MKEGAGEDNSYNLSRLNRLKFEALLKRIIRAGKNSIFLTSHVKESGWGTLGIPPLERTL